MKHNTIIQVIICILLVATSCANSPENTISPTQDITVTPTATEITDITGDSWLSRASMPTPRSGAAAAVIDGKIYVIGGYSRDDVFALNECYDPETDIWTTMSPMPYPRSGAFAAVVEGKIYVIGGVDATLTLLSRNEMYDPLADAWTTMASMPTPRAAPCAGVVDGKIYVIGGTGGDTIALGNSTSLVKVLSSANEEYNPLTDTWMQKSPMPTPRWRPAGCAIGETIYVIGGWGHDGITDVTEQYNPGIDLWETLSPIPTRRTATVAVPLDNNIYVIGGHSLKNFSETLNEENFLLISANEEYDTVNDIWTSRQSMLTGRAGTTAGAINGKIYVIGGAFINPDISYLVYSDKNEEYTPQR